MGRKHLQILLVDNDQEDCELFEAALGETSIHAQLKVTDNCDSLINWLLEEKTGLPDVLFLDLNMPRKSGLECLLEIKQNPHLSTLPVIIFTQMMYPMLVEALYRNGAYYFIQKPNSFRQLAHVLERVLDLPEEKNGVQPAWGDFVFSAT